MRYFFDFEPSQSPDEDGLDFDSDAAAVRAAWESLPLAVADLDRGTSRQALGIVVRREDGAHIARLEVQVTAAMAVPALWSQPPIAATA